MGPPAAGPLAPAAATRLTLQLLARRHRHLSDESAALDARLAPLVAAAAPALLGVHGVGPEGAAALRSAAGDHPQRLRTEAAFAQLCGVAPLPASSGPPPGLPARLGPAARPPSVAAPCAARVVPAAGVTDGSAVRSSLGRRGAGRAGGGRRVAAAGAGLVAAPGAPPHPGAWAGPTGGRSGRG